MTTHWPPEMDLLWRQAEQDPILHSALTLGTVHGLPSLAVLSLAWRETMRATRQHIEDLERLTRQPSPIGLALLDYFARMWRGTAIEETPHIRRRRRHWRPVAEARIGLLYAAARERAALLRLVEQAHALHSKPMLIIGPCRGAEGIELRTTPHPLASPTGPVYFVRLDSDEKGQG